MQQGHHSGDGVTIDSEDEQKLDLVSTDEQTWDLLRLLFSLGVAVAILFRWSDNFPVFTTFEAIPFPLARGLTLLGLTRVILIVVVTYIAVRNLPGLLELAVRRATTVDAGTRNAIFTLCQYAVIAIGVSLLFNAINVGLGEVGLDCSCPKRGDWLRPAGSGGQFRVWPHRTFRASSGWVISSPLTA